MQINYDILAKLVGVIDLGVVIGKMIPKNKNYYPINILYHNRSAEEKIKTVLLSNNDETFVDKFLKFIDDQKMLSTIKSSVENNKSILIDFNNLYNFEMKILPFHNDCVAFIFHDVTKERELQQHLEKITILCEELSITLNRESSEVIQSSLIKMIEMFNFRHGVALNLLPSQKENFWKLKMIAGVGIPEKLVGHFQLITIDKKSPTIISQCIFSEKTVVINNLKEKNLLDGKIREIYQQLGITGVICCPIIVNDEVLGVVEFSRDNNQSFTDDEIKIISTFYKNLGIAIKEQNFELDLFKEKKETDFIIKLMTHDLSNLNMVNYACLEDIENIIKEKCYNEELVFFLDNLKKSVNKTQRLVDTLRSLNYARRFDMSQSESISVREGLEQSIEELIYQNPEITIDLDLRSNDPGLILGNETLFIDLVSLIIYQLLEIKNTKRALVVYQTDSDSVIIHFYSEKILPKTTKIKLREIFPIEEIGGTKADLLSLSLKTIRMIIDNFSGKIDFNQMTSNSMTRVLSLIFPLLTAEKNK